MSSHVGTARLEKFIENTAAYKSESDATKQGEMKSGAFGKWMAYLLIETAI